MQKCFETKHYAETYHKLLLALGYDQYGQCKTLVLGSIRANNEGGNWGFLSNPHQGLKIMKALTFLVARALGHLYPQHVKGSHVNWAFATPPKWTESNPEPEYSAREKAQLARLQGW